MIPNVKHNWNKLKQSAVNVLPSLLSSSFSSPGKCPSQAPFELDCCCCCCCCLLCTGCRTRCQTAETCESSMLCQKWSWIMWIINDILEVKLFPQWLQNSWIMWMVNFCRKWSCFHNDCKTAGIMWMVNVISEVKLFSQWLQNSRNMWIVILMSEMK